MNRRNFIKYGIVGTVGFILPIKALAQNIDNQNNLTDKRKVWKKHRVAHNQLRIDRVEFMELKKGDEFCMAESNGGFIKGKKGGDWFVATSDAYIDNFGNGNTGTIMADEKIYKEFGI